MFILLYCYNNNTNKLLAITTLPITVINIIILFMEMSINLEE